MLISWTLATARISLFLEGVTWRSFVELLGLATEEVLPGSGHHEVKSGQDLNPGLCSSLEDAGKGGLVGPAETD